jgi:nitrate reductase gamma subunit
MTTLQMILWVAIPYASIAVFVVGHIWRYRYDKFGWTTRSSQTYENRLLRWGSPMFHFGILMVIAGHVVGLFIPREWLYAIGINEEMYHIGATVLGTFAAVLTLAGLAILIYRRRTVGPVFLATTTMDKVMYVFLGATLLFGTAARRVPGVRRRIPLPRDDLAVDPQHLPVPTAGRADGRGAAAVPAAHPDGVRPVRAVAVHAARARLLRAGRLPLPPYVVYRSRDAERGARPARRGWDPVKAPDPERLHKL